MTNSLVGRGGSTTPHGESLIFDLPHGTTFFVLPIWEGKDGSFGGVFEGAVLKTFGIDSSFGTLTDEDFAKMKALSGRKPFKYYGHMPAFVSFRKETQPKTIFQLQPYKMEQTFPGVKFIGLDIEITDAPITTKLRQRLPWLDAGKQVLNANQPATDSATPSSLQNSQSTFFRKREQIMTATQPNSCRLIDASMPRKASSVRQEKRNVQLSVTNGASGTATVPFFATGMSPRRFRNGDGV